MHEFFNQSYKSCGNSTPVTNNDVREQMFKDQQDQLEQDMAPFGFVVNGLEDENIGEMVDEYGTKWNPIVRQYDTNW